MAKKVVTHKEIVDTIKKEVRSLPYIQTGIISVLVFILGIIGLAIVPMEYSALPAILSNVGIGLGIFYLIDRFTLNSVHTLDEIKKGNISYAIFLLAIAIIILGSILAT